MNSYRGTINSVNTSGAMSIVEVDMGEDIRLKTIVLETPDSASYLQTGQPVDVLFKETEVVIGLDADSKVSLQNKIPGSITTIEKGELVTKLKIKTAIGEVVSIISSNGVNQLGLKEGSDVIAMIKLNEVMLSH